MKLGRSYSSPAMFERISVLAVTTGLLLAAVTVVTTAAPSEQESVISLQNGQVLRGMVSQAGNRFIVRLANGGEIRVPVNEVEVVGKDLGEVYLYKRHRINPERVEDHYHLADWCLRQKLYTRSMEEIDWIKRLRPNWPRIKTLERRLDLALSPPKQAKRKTAATQPGLSRQELDDYVKALPSSSVAQFTHRIQPLLVNRCASAGCHGNDSAKFHLTRTARGRTLTRRITQINLYAVMKHVDRDSPSRSRVLIAPLGPHGNAHEAVFGERDLEQYEQLRDWVLGLANPKQQQATEQVAQTAATGPASLPSRSQQVAGLRNAPVGGSVPMNRQNMDPFDPSGFNARHGRSNGAGRRQSQLSMEEVFPRTNQSVQAMDGPGDFGHVRPAAHNGPTTADQFAPGHADSLGGRVEQADYQPIGASNLAPIDPMTQNLQPENRQRGSLQRGIGRRTRGHTGRTQPKSLQTDIGQTGRAPSGRQPFGYQTGPGQPAGVPQAGNQRPVNLQPISGNQPTFRKPPGLRRVNHGRNSRGGTNQTGGYGRQGQFPNSQQPNQTNQFQRPPQQAPAMRQGVLPNQPTRPPQRSYAPMNQAGSRSNQGTPSSFPPLK